MSNNEKKDFDYRLILITTFLISICSIVYELIISSVSSYLLGDSITQFSITIGLYMFAMGVGSYLSKKIKNKLFNKFVYIELLVGIFGGLSSLILFFSNIYTTIYQLIMYILIIIIGILVGLEIPILTRIIENNKSDVRNNLANIFSFDYLGGLIGSLIFPLILLPNLGYITTTLLIGTINIFVALLIVIKYKKFVFKYSTIRNIVIIILGIFIIFLCTGRLLADNIEDGLYKDAIILSKQTNYQKIIMTRHKDDIRLFIDGNLQFCSKDEYRYHEALVHIPMLYANKHDEVLILGGGDGLAAREILKYNDVKNITLVDIDEQMTDLCKNNELISTLNNHSLESQKLNIINEDAYMFIQNTDKKYDVVIIDLPDPNSDTLNKLYTNVFYNYIKNIMNKDGVMVCQSTSPYYAKNSFWCINKTIATQFENVKPYHLQVPSFGEWGFNLAYNGNANLKELQVDTKYLNKENINLMFNFGKDELADVDKLEINDIFKPKLIEYYNNEVIEW
ncbi:MAG: polyamine aminopropyltransferase [Clostridia bacterium]|nr:polyamine aminopropyltransferase [Clostridia bacterium]